MDTTATHTDPIDTPVVMDAGTWYGRLSELAETCASLQGYWRGALGLLCEFFQATYGRLQVNVSAETFKDYWHRGAASPDFWRKPVEEMALNCQYTGRESARLYGAKSGDSRVAILSVPLYNPSGHPIGAATLVIHVDDKSQTQAILSRLLAEARLASSFAQKIIPTTGPHEPSNPAQAQWSGIERVAKYSDRIALAYAVTNNLCSKIGCDLVALGTVRGHHATVLSVSGLDELNSKSGGYERVRQAMEECLDHTSPIVMNLGDQADENNHLKFRLHQAWCASANALASASLPLFDGQQIVGVVSLLRYGNRPFTEDQIVEIQRLLEPIGPALKLLEKADRTLPRHIIDTASQKTRLTLKGPGKYRLMRQLVLLAALTWFIFGSMTYTMTANSVVMPNEQYHLTTPFEGTLAEVSVAGGDRVTKGQVLGRLDTTLLQEKKNKILSQINAMQIAYDAAVGLRDMTRASLTSAQIQVHQAELKSVEHRIKQAELISPCDGIVVHGDNQRRIGQVLPLGETLFEIAADTGWKIEIQVSDRKVDELPDHMIGRFASNAEPDKPMPIRVNRVQPVVTERQGRKVVICEADIQMDSPKVWSGFEGIAKIECGKHKVWWIVLHQTIDWVRLKLWI